MFTAIIYGGFRAGFEGYVSSSLRDLTEVMVTSTKKGNTGK
jgi:hypothetical protein